MLDVLDLSTFHDLPSVLAQFKANTLGPIPFRNLLLDSRQVQSGDVFVAMQGERVDGHDFISQALQLGCVVVVGERQYLNDKLINELQNKFENVHFILVSDSLQFLQQWSHRHIQKWLKCNECHQVIGITGTNGKTTTKDIMSHLLQTIFPKKVQWTQGNHNNHLGVPLTLLSVRSHHRFLIVEMGTNHPGEIATLCQMAIPSSGLITNIGPGHLEFFHNEDGVFQEKRVLFDAICSNALLHPPLRRQQQSFIINGDDPRLLTLLKEFPHSRSEQLQCLVLKKCSENARALSAQDDKTIYWQYEISAVRIFWRDQEYILENPSLIGIHNFFNLTASFTLVASICSEAISDLVKAAKGFVPTRNRSSWVEWKEKKCFLDAYNANPMSMQSSIAGLWEEITLRQIDPDKVCFVLGDMNELGEQSIDYHQKMGQYLANLGIKHVAFVGRFAVEYKRGWEEQTNHHLLPTSQIFESVQQLKNGYWSQMVERYEYFFIKGSRSVGLEQLLN